MSTILKGRLNETHITTAVLGAGVGYALLRYVGLGDVEVANVAVFVLNKAIAFAASALLAAVVGLTAADRLSPGRRWTDLRKALGVHALALSAVHVLLTLSILDPAYYSKLFEEGARMNAKGEIAVLAGVLCFGAVVRRGKAALTAAAFGLCAMHVSVLGYTSWLKPETWPGGLPPITMVTMAALAAGLMPWAALAGRKLAGPTPARNEDVAPRLSLA